MNGLPAFWAASRSACSSSGRGEVAIGGAARQQLLDGRLIFVQPLRLIVRPIRPADFRAFVPIEAQPLQAVQDRSERFLDVPLLRRCRRCAG